MHISAGSLVTRSILKPGHYTGIFPFDDNAAWEKNAATLKQLHSLRERLKALEKMTMQTETMTTMDIHQILKQLPHRYPFLLIDRVLELEKGKSIVALKNVTINEPFFVGHFPHRPVMPGVLMLEAHGAGRGAAVVRTRWTSSPTTTRSTTSPASTARASSGRWSRATSSCST